MPASFSMAFSHEESFLLLSYTHVASCPPPPAPPPAGCDECDVSCECDTPCDESAMCSLPPCVCVHTCVCVCIIHIKRCKYTYIILHTYTQYITEGAYLFHGQEAAAATTTTEVLALVRFSTIQIPDLDYFDPVLGLRAQRRGQHLRVNVCTYIYLHTHTHTHTRTHTHTCVCVYIHTPRLPTHTYTMPTTHTHTPHTPAPHTHTRHQVVDISLEAQADCLGQSNLEISQVRHELLLRLRVHIKL